MNELVLDQPLRPLLELLAVTADPPAEDGRRDGAGQRLGPLTVRFNAGSITGLIGLAGAGRQTLLQLITGEVMPTGGVIRLEGERIDHLDPAARARLGVIATGPRRLVLPGTLGAMLATARAMVTLPWWRLAFGIGHHANASDGEDIAAILSFLGLSDVADRPVASLVGLEARLGDIARCLVQRPLLLVLDQPLAGLSSDERSSMARLFVRLKRAELTLIVLDDDLSTLSEVADRCLALHRGRMIANTTPAAIGSASHVFEALTGSTL